MSSLCQQQQQHGSLLPLLLDVVSQPPTEYQQHVAMHSGAPMGHPMQQPIMAPGRPHMESPAGSYRAPCAEPVTDAECFRMSQTTSPGQQHGQLPGSCPSQQQQPDAGQQQCQLRLLLVPHNTASRGHVADLGQAVNISIPIAKESKTLQSVSRHYTAKWTAPGQAAPQLRFHAASDQAGRQLKGTCWGPDIGKGVTMQFLRAVLGAQENITLEYEVVTAGTAVQRAASTPAPAAQQQQQQQQTKGKARHRDRQPLQPARQPGAALQDQLQRPQQATAVSGELRVGLEKMLQMLGGAGGTREPGLQAAVCAETGVGPGAEHRTQEALEGASAGGAGPGPGSSCQTLSHSQQRSDKAHPWQWRLQQRSQQSQNLESASGLRAGQDPALSPGSTAMPSSMAGTACGSTGGTVSGRDDRQECSVMQGGSRLRGRTSGSRGNGGAGCGVAEAESMFSSSLFGADDGAQQPPQQQPQQPQQSLAQAQQQKPQAMAWQAAELDAAHDGNVVPGGGAAGLVKTCMPCSGAEPPGTHGSAGPALPDPFLQPRGAGFRGGALAGGGAAPALDPLDRLGQTAAGAGQTLGQSMPGAVLGGAHPVSPCAKPPAHGTLPVQGIGCLDALGGMGEMSCDLLDLCISPQPWRGRAPNPDPQPWHGQDAAMAATAPDLHPWAADDPACTPAHASQAWYQPAGGCGMQGNGDQGLGSGRCTGQLQQQQQQQQQQHVAGVAQVLLKPRTWRLHASPCAKGGGSGAYRIARVKPPPCSQQQPQQLQQALAGNWRPMLPSAGDVACVDEQAAAVSVGSSSALQDMLLGQLMAAAPNQQQTPAPPSQPAAHAFMHSAAAAAASAAAAAHFQSQVQQQQQQQLPSFPMPWSLASMAAANGITSSCVVPDHTLACNGAGPTNKLQLQQGTGAPTAAWAQTGSPRHASAAMPPPHELGQQLHHFTGADQVMLEPECGSGRPGQFVSAQPAVLPSPAQQGTGNGGQWGQGQQGQFWQQGSEHPPQAQQGTGNGGQWGQGQARQQGAEQALRDEPPGHFSDPQKAAPAADPALETQVKAKSGKVLRQGACIKGGKVLKQGTLRSTHPMLAVKFSRVQTQPTPNASSAAAPAAGARQVLLPGAWGSWAAAGPGGQPQGWPQAEGWLRVAGAGTGVAPLQKEPQGAPKSAAKRRVRKARSTAGSGAPSAADEGRHGAGGDAWTPAGAGRALPPRGAAASVTSGGSDGSGGSQQPQQQQHQAEQAHGLRQDDVVQGGDALALPSTKAGVPSTPAPGAAGGGKRLSAGASDKQPRQRSLKAAKRNARASPGTVALQHEGATQRTHSGASTGSGDSPEAPSRLAGSGASAPGEEGMASLWGERGALSGQAAGPSGQQQQQQQELQPAAPAGGRPAPRPGRREVPLPFFVKSSGANGGQRGRTPPPPAGGGATAGASLSGMARSASLPAPAPAAAQPKAIAAAVAGAPRAAAPIRLGSGDREGGEVMQGVVHQDGAAGPLGASGNVMVTAAGPLGKADGRPPLALRPTAAATAPFVLPDPELTKLFALGDSWLGPEASRNAFGVAWSLSCLEGPSGLGASLLPALLGHSQHQQQQQTVKQCAETRAGSTAPTEFTGMLLHQRNAPASNGPAAAASEPAGTALAERASDPPQAGTAAANLVEFAAAMAGHARTLPAAAASGQGVSAGQLLSGLGALPLPPPLQLPPLPPQAPSQPGSMQLLSSIFDELSNAMSGSLSLEGPEGTTQQQQQQQQQRQGLARGLVGGVTAAGRPAPAPAPAALAPSFAGIAAQALAAGSLPAAPFCGLTLGANDSLWGMLADVSHWQPPGLPGGCDQPVAGAAGPRAGDASAFAEGAVTHPTPSVDRPFAALFRQ